MKRKGAPPLKVHERIAGLELAIALVVNILHAQGVAKRSETIAAMRQAAAATEFRPEAAEALLAVANLIEALGSVEGGRPALRLVGSADPQPIRE